jgi:hypothetical protein
MKKKCKHKQLEEEVESNSGVKAGRDQVLGAVKRQFSRKSY